MRSREAIGAVVGRVARAVVEGDVVDIEAGAVADAEAVDGVVLDVDVVDGARSKNRLELDEVVGPGKMLV